MGKRGQIGLFIIAGTIMLMMALLGIHFFSEKEKKINDEKIIPYFKPTQAIQVNEFVSECLKETAYDGAYIVGLQGGYYWVKDPKTSISLIDVPYYYDKSNIDVLSEEKIGKSVSSFVEENIDFCLNDFNNFPGLEISYVQPSVHSSITNEGISITLNYPALIGQKENQQKLPLVSVNLPIRFADMRNAASKIIRIQEEDPQYICLSCLDEIAEQYNLTIEFQNKGNDSVVFILKSNEEVKEEKFLFRFAVRYGVS